MKGRRSFSWLSTTSSSICGDDSIALPPNFAVAFGAFAVLLANFDGASIAIVDCWASCATPMRS